MEHLAVVLCRMDWYGALGYLKCRVWYKSKGDQSAVVTCSDMEPGLMSNDMLWYSVVGKNVLWRGVLYAS